MEYWEHWACWELGSGWACFSVACLCNHINKSGQPVLILFADMGIGVHVRINVEMLLVVDTCFICCI